MAETNTQEPTTEQVVTQETTEPVTPPGVETTEEEKPLTMEMVQKLVQSAEDRIRTEKTKIIKQLETEKEEAIKAGMKESERKQYELDKMLEEATKERAELRAEKLKNTAIELLNESKMPLSFKDFIIGADEEAIKANIASLKTVFNEAVANSVSDRMKGLGSAPPASNSVPVGEKAKLIQQYNEAEKQGNLALKLSTLEQIKKLDAKP